MGSPATYFDRPTFFPQVQAAPIPFPKIAALNFRPGRFFPCSYIGDILFVPTHIHTKEHSMNGDSPEEAPVEWSLWPPPLASRAIRRHCQHMVKAGYCALCGTKVSQ